MPLLRNAGISTLWAALAVLWREERRLERRAELYYVQCGGGGPAADLLRYRRERMAVLEAVCVSLVALVGARRG